MAILWFQAFTNILLAVGLYILFRKLTDLETEGSYQDVDGPPRDHWLTGSFQRIYNDGFDYILRNLERYGGVFQFAGPYWTKFLLVSDPLAIHHIMVKEQEIFHETDIFLSGNYLVFGQGLLSTEGEQHRKQRKLLNPAFSTTNMQDMLPAIQPIADKLRASIASQVNESGGAFPSTVPSWMTRASIEYIAQAGMGYSFDTLDVNNRAASDFLNALKEIMPLNMRLRFLQPIIPYVVRYIPAYWRNKLVDWLPIPALKEMQESVFVMYNTSRKILAERKAELEREMQEDIVNEGSASRPKMRGKDIISILLRANASTHGAEKMSEEEVLCQMSVFIFAGFETTSVTLSRVLYLLARDEFIQCRLRGEIRKAKQEYATFQSETEVGENEVRWEDIELPYDILIGLPYLDAVLKETLRLYPPVAGLVRVAKSATTLPLQFPIRSRSGHRMNVIPIPAGSIVTTSILGANYCKEIWGDDAYEFKPERWITAQSGNKPRRASIASKMPLDEFESGIPHEANGGQPGTKSGMKYPGIYSSMMTFGAGNRACIGFRFAEMEIKQVITTLLSTLHFSLPADKEIYWKVNNFQTPVVRPPAGDNMTRQVPLKVRPVREGDFMTV